MLYLYALVMTLANGQSFIIQEDLSRTMCSVEMQMIKERNFLSSNKVKGKGTMSFTFKDQDIEYDFKHVEAPTYECHLVKVTGS